MLLAKDIAERIGVHRSTVSRIATRKNIGTQVGRQRIFAASDVQKVKRFCYFRAGNPTFGKKDLQKV